MTTIQIDVKVILMRKISIALFILFSLFVIVENTQAKVLPQVAKSGSKTTVKSSVGSGINVTPRLRSDKRAVIVYFSNLQNASSVSYTLTYNTSAQQEGAIGSLNLAASRTSQELLFGTCSKNACRYHSGISNMKLEVSYTTKAGKKFIKKYRIKV